jgi:hypothetical protein
MRVLDQPPQRDDGWRPRFGERQFEKKYALFRGANGRRAQRDVRREPGIWKFSGNIENSRRAWAPWSPFSTKVSRGAQDLRVHVLRCRWHEEPKHRVSLYGNGIELAGKREINERACREATCPLRNSRPQNYRGHPRPAVLVLAGQNEQGIGPHRRSANAERKGRSTRRGPYRIGRCRNPGLIQAWDDSRSTRFAQQARTHRAGF